jgi:hypothetical protein
MTNEVCYRCSGNCHTPLPKETHLTGIIYVRQKNKDDKWDNMPICKTCWDKENPDRPNPVMMRDIPLESKKK